MTRVDTAVWLTAGYAVFLVLVAYGFDHLARVTARRSDRWRTGSFVYHADHDAWVCPQDQWLWPVSFDADNRVMRYRATPTVCNACPVKASCTTSSKGREITREVDPWPHSEAGRFHRGIACTIAALAVLLPSVSLMTERDALDAVVLLAAIAVAGMAGIPLGGHFWNTPDGFPEHVPVESEPGPMDVAATADPVADDTADTADTVIDAADAIADAQRLLIPPSRRSVYGSDNASTVQPRRDRYGARRGAVKTKEYR